MLLDRNYHQKLLAIPWLSRRHDHKSFYIKHLFDTDEYFVLITDLRLVWFEHGDFNRIQRNAKLPNIDIDTEEEARSVLERVKMLFKESVETRKRYTVTLTNNGNRLKLHCSTSGSAASASNINKFSWIFDCELLDQVITDSNARETATDNTAPAAEATVNLMTGPELIYECFLYPSQAVVNHFTEDEAPIELKLGEFRESMFSTSSLAYIHGISSKRKGRALDEVTQSRSVAQSVEIEEEPEPSPELTEEQAAERLKEERRRLAEEEKKRNPVKRKRRL